MNKYLAKAVLNEDTGDLYHVVKESHGTTSIAINKLGSLDEFFRLVKKQTHIFPSTSFTPSEWTKYVTLKQLQTYTLVFCLLILMFSFS